MNIEKYTLKKDREDLYLFIVKQLALYKFDLSKGTAEEQAKKIMDLVYEQDIKFLNKLLNELDILWIPSYSKILNEQVELYSGYKIDSKIKEMWYPCCEENEESIKNIRNKK